MLKIFKLSHNQYPFRVKVLGKNITNGISDQMRMKHLVINTVCILLIVLGVLLAVLHSKITFVDDAWITFRYSANLANTGQLVFNQGEKVEGLSNLLWGLIIAGVSKVLPLSIPVIATSCALLLITGSLILLWRVGVLLDLNPLPALIPPMLLVLTSGFFKASTNGLEIPLFLFLSILVIFFFLREQYIPCFIFLGLLFLTRIEAIGIGLFFIVLILTLGKKEKRKSAFIGIGILLGIVLAATLFRISYFGDFIPNSVRDKQIPVNSGLILSGIRYILEYFLNYPVFAVVIFAGLLLLIRQILMAGIKPFYQSLCTERIRKLLVIVLACILFSFVVILKNGGDWMPNYRLIFQYGILMACLVIVLLKEKSISIVIGIALLIGPFIQTVDLFLYRIRHEENFQIAEFSAGMPFWKEAVDNLSNNLINSDIVSAEAIGYIGYNLPQVSIHDPLGLIDHHIALHGKPAVPFGKTDIVYTVEQIMPSVLIWHYSGHLDDLYLPEIDQLYTTFCYQECESWNADVVMIRADRVADFVNDFEDWKVITLKSLQ